MKKAVFYARVSSDIQQKEGTIQSQIAELKKQISKAGDKLVREYADDGYSGALLDRPAMDQLRQDLKSNLFEVIYILNTDRIARDVTYQNIIIGEMLRYKKQIIINGKDYVHNPENKFTLTVLGAVSELERAKLIERSMRGRQHRLKQGILLSNGHQTYGYTYFKKTTESFPYYEINTKEAEVVRYIFETYAKGQVGIRTISRQLEDMGIPKVRGRNRLNQTQLKHILGNEMYTGTRYFNTMSDRDSSGIRKKKHGKQIRRDRSDWIGIKIPPIISKELFNAVQKRLEYNRQCYRNSKRVQLLSHLVWCDKCNVRCYAYRRRSDRSSSKIHRYVVYKCGSKTAGVHNPEINGAVLESCVFDMIRNSMLVPEKLYASISFLRRRGSVDKQKIERQLRAAEKKITEIAQRKTRIVDLYASENLEQEEYVKRIREYDKNIDKLQTQRADLLKYIPLFQDQALIKQSVNNFCVRAREQYGKCTDFDTRRQFLLDHVTKVAYYRKNRADAKVKIYGSIPITLKDTSDTIPVEFKIEKTMDWHEFRSRTPKLSESDQEYWRAPVFVTYPAKI